ncbi:MAG: hypothetical protein V5A55_11920 [Halovenus sp.]
MGPDDSISIPEDMTRRSVLAAMGGCSAIGLAGCSDDESNTDGGTETGDGGNGGNSQESVIPGELVHNDLENIEVRNHWATADDFVKIRLRNSRDEEFAASFTISKGDPVIQGRTLSEEGNELGDGVWYGEDFGPDSVNAGTEATIGFLINAGAANAARYELCLTDSPVADLSLTSWEEMCGESTEEE